MNAPRATSADVADVLRAIVGPDLAEEVLPSDAEWVVDSINNGIVIAHRLADELHEMHAAEAIDLDQWPTAREWLTAIGRSER